MKRCYYCMSEYSDEFEICPHCGHVNEEKVENALHMFPGSVLCDKYIIGRVIGYGGFGVTYLAWDTVLRTKVAIKEYLPSEFSTRAAGQTQVTVFSGDKAKQFADGMNKFLDEAKRLAKFRKENGIVKIFDCFNENGTAYIVMEYLQGETLAKHLEKENTVPVDEAVELLMPIIESLNKVHDEGIIHRDIAPDNIFLTDKGEVKLIDFGASRYATTSKSRSLTVIIKPGYSAEEQYRSRSDQGSHTDVYSVGAVLYRMITGQSPPDAMERRALFEKSGKDMLIPIRKFDKNIDRNKENAIHNALNIRISDRTPDMISLAGELMSDEPVAKRRSGIKKIDILTWPLWAKIGIPAGIVAVITLCVLLAFGVIGPKSKLATNYVVPDGQVLIPNIVQESVEDAQDTLRKESLTPRISDRVESAVIGRNLVLRQDPDAFNVVNKGSLVDIIISDGKGMSIIPDVVGLTVEFATQQLKKAGFEVATVEEPSEIVAKGAVISQDFEAESAVEKGTTVTLKISTGPENVDTSKTVQVPNIVGMDLEKARAELKKYKLGAAVDSEIYNEKLPDNQVVSQMPGKNVEAHQGDTVYLTVNKKQKTVSVIDYRGRIFNDVEKELLAAGFAVDAEYVQNKDYAPGTICKQNIVNKSVPVGTKIILTVSEGYLVKVTDVSGKQRSQAEDILVDQGLSVAVITEYSNTVEKGRVISHDHANEEVELGTTITLVVSSGKEPENKEDTTAKPQEIALTSISISSKPSRTEYYVGDRFNSSGISVTAGYSDSSSRDITSQCKIPDIRFETAGSETITVSYQENGISKTASFSVNVIEPSITIDETKITIVEGETRTISYRTKPSNVSLSWKSDRNDIATVSNGKITGVSNGNTAIRAIISYEGEEFESLPIYVSVATEEDLGGVSKIEFKSRLKTKDYYIGDILKKNEIEIWAIKAEGREQIYDFTCSPEKLDSEGSQTITISYAGHTLTETVNVKIPSLSLNCSSLNMDKGDARAIQANPNTKENFEIIWDSSPSGIVQIVPDSESVGKMNATVKAVAGGTTTITAKIKYKETVYESDSCTVTVKADKTLSRIDVKNTNPSNIYYIGDEFYSSDLAVTAVYSDGSTEKVTEFECYPDGKGTVKVKYVGKESECSYTVKTPTITCSFKNSVDTIDLTNDASRVFVVVNCTPNNGNWEITYSTDSSSIKVNSTTGAVEGVSQTESARVKIKAVYNSNYETTATVGPITVYESEAQIQYVGLGNDNWQTYRVGDTINRSGYYAEVHYDNGTVERTTSPDKLIVTFENGDTTLRKEYVKYKGRSFYTTVYLEYRADGRTNDNLGVHVEVDVATPILSFDTSSLHINEGENNFVDLDVYDMELVESRYSVEWSTDSSCVSLSNKSMSGVTVTGESAGTATVTATLYYDGYEIASDSFTVTVEEMPTTGNWDDYYAEYY